MKVGVGIPERDSLPWVDLAAAAGDYASGSYSNADLPVGVIVVSAGVLDWIIDRLPADDMVTKELCELREQAKEAVWKAVSE